VPPDIEPKLVKIDFDGAISVNAAASLIPLDRADSDSSLPLLNEDLLSYAAAARGAASTPVVQILVDGDATYQRWMDVMARCHANGFTRVLVVDVNMDIETTCQGMTCPASNPGPGHLPVAPSADRLATQFPIRVD
jgi:biopolymer transport protein ExbD